MSSRDTSPTDEERRADLEIRNMPVPAHLRTADTEPEKVKGKVDGASVSDDGASSDQVKKGNGTEGETLQALLTRMVEIHEKNGEGGRLPEPGGRQLPLFVGKEVTAYLENFVFQCNQSRLSEEERIRQFPAYCEADFRATVHGLIEGLGDRRTWKEFESVMKKQF